MASHNTKIENGKGSRPATIYRSLCASVGALLLLAATACSLENIQFQFGERHDPLLLDSALEIGVSTRSDVLRVIGKPHGEGRSMLPGTTKPQPTWTYYYEAGTLKDARRQFLWIYFDGDVYDGYMWFSSFGAQLAAHTVTRE